ncbi:MAG: gliding motility-associated C-terminal domain-containing protein, partial [Flavobacteriales bacterium]|nr:gliding motility-associated C-terminal domain-containing protein [Flavobacteriales bacterium]
AFICQGSSITLNGSGTGTFSWSPSTGLSSTTISNPVATPATTISYILTVNGGGCTDSDTVLVTVSPTPTLTISNDTTICIGECATLNVSGADFYSWTPGTGMTDSTASGQTVCPATTTTYTVTGYTVSNNSVNNGDFSSGNTGFNSDYIFTNNTQPEGTYYVATDASISHPSFVGSDHTTGTGNFMIVNGSGTPNSSVWCQTISVQPNTDYVFSTWVSTLAPGSPALLQFSINGTALGTPFQAPAGTNQWIEFYTTWNSGASTTAVICIVNQNTTLGGNDFGLDDIFFSAICSATEQVTVTVNPPQDATITQQSPLCADAAAVQLSAVDGGGTWSGNGVTSGGSFNPANASIGNNIITYSIPGSCGDVDTMTIVVNALPTANAGADQILPCNPNQVNLNGTGSSSGNGITYQWTGGTISAGSTTTTPTVTASGTYTLVVTDANGCVASDVVVVNNATPPVASFTATPTSGTIPLVVNTTNTSTGTGLIYLWDNGLGQSSTASEPSFTYTVPGNPDLMLVVTDANGCVDTAWTVLTLYEEYELIIPNVFSPNGDGTNDEFEIIHKGISMIHVSIYNRWGVFMTGYDGITQNWDGKKDNKLAPDGTYFYIIKVTKVTGEELEFNGTVTLMK